jgi:uncharacterized protein YjbJ (UPF0337 family)
MNEDQVRGKVKDVAGRIERQAGEWTGDEKKGVHGTMKTGGRHDSERLGQCQRRRQKDSRQSESSVQEPPAKSAGRR